MLFVSSEFPSGVTTKSGEPCCITTTDWLTKYELTLSGIDLKILRFLKTSPIGSVVRISEGDSSSVNELAASWLRENGIIDPTEGVVTLTDKDYQDGIEKLFNSYQQELDSYERTLPFQTKSDTPVDLRSSFQPAVTKEGHFFTALAVYRMRCGADPQAVDEALSPGTWFAYADTFSAELSLAVACERLMN